MYNCCPHSVEVLGWLPVTMVLSLCTWMELSPLVIMLHGWCLFVGVVGLLFFFGYCFLCCWQLIFYFSSLCYYILCYHWYFTRVVDQQSFWVFVYHYSHSCRDVVWIYWRLSDHNPFFSSCQTAAVMGRRWCFWFLGVPGLLFVFSGDIKYILVLVDEFLYLVQ